MKVIPIPSFLTAHALSALRRVLFTFDDDLLSEATERQKAGKPFCGVVYAHPLQISIGKCISDLQVIGQAGESQDMVVDPKGSG